MSPSGDGAVEWASWRRLVVGTYAVAVKSEGSAAHQPGSPTCSVLHFHLLSDIVIPISWGS